MEADILELSRQLEHPTLGASQAAGLANGAGQRAGGHALGGRCAGWAGTPPSLAAAPANRPRHRLG